MRIILEFPPIYHEVVAAFDLRGRQPIFAWGDKIYNPHGIAIPPELIEHERVHMRRQNGDPAAWWRRYIDDPRFRLNEELLAHRTEYLAHISKPTVTRNQRRIVLRHIAQRLASKLYGSLISVDDAKIAIADPEKPFRTRLDTPQPGALAGERPEPVRNHPPK